MKYEVELDRKIYRDNIVAISLWAYRNCRERVPGTRTVSKKNSFLGKTIFTFKYAEDALAFKLRWG